MDYTIMNLDSVFGDIEVSLNASGNKYYICLWNKYLHESTTKMFDDIDDAFLLFIKFANAIAKGLYSYEKKKSWLV